MIYYALKDFAFTEINITEGATWLENGYTLWKKEEDISYNLDTIISETDEIANQTEVEDDEEDDEETTDSETTNDVENCLLLSTDEDNNLYNNGAGYKDGYTLNSDGEEEELEGLLVTGYVTASYGDTLYLQSIELTTTSTNEMIAFYNINKELLFADSIANSIADGYITVNSDDSDNINDITIAEIDELIDMFYFRISSTSISSESKIYQNEEPVEDDEDEETESDEEITYTADSLIADGWIQITADTLASEITEYNITNSETGFYVYKDNFTEEDGSTSVIYYLHNLNDNPNTYDSTTDGGDTTKDGHVMGGDNTNRSFPSSDMVWKMTAEKMLMSSNGGLNYPFDVAVNGTAIMNKINALSSITVGSNSSNNVYINGTDVQIRKGSTTVATFGENCTIKNLKATTGQIGGFNLGATYITSNTSKTTYNDTSNNGVFIGSSGIGLGQGKFTVSNAGSLTATSGKIGGFNIGSASLANGKTSFSETDNDGLYVGTDGISLGKGTLKLSKTGALTATNATISGNVTASTGTIAGFTLGTNDSIKYMASGSKTEISDGVSGVYVGTDGIEVGDGAFIVHRSPATAQCKSLRATSELTAGYMTAEYLQMDGNSICFDYANQYEKKPDSYIRAMGLIAIRPHYWATSEADGYYQGYQLQFFREQTNDAHRTIIRPATNSGIYLGSSDYRFNTGFFTNSITASDLKEKEVIEDYDWHAEDFILGLKPIAYRRTGAEDGGNRIHMGFGAQDVSELCNKISMGNMSLYQASRVDEDGVEWTYDGSKEIDDSQLAWGLNYNEFIAPMVAEMQNLIKKNKELEERIQALERGDSNE